jgi:hypothetical protein
MLFVHLSGDGVDEVDDAVSARIDQERDQLVCLDAEGQVVTTYPRSAVLAFSTLPFVGSIPMGRRRRRPAT